MVCDQSSLIQYSGVDGDADNLDDDDDDDDAK